MLRWIATYPVDKVIPSLNRLKAKKNDNIFFAIFETCFDSSDEICSQISKLLLFF